MPAHLPYTRPSPSPPLGAGLVPAHPLHAALSITPSQPACRPTSLTRLSFPLACRPCACPPPLHATLSTLSSCWGNPRACPLPYTHPLHPPRNPPVTLAPAHGLVPAHLPYTPPSPSPPCNPPVDAGPEPAPSRPKIALHLPIPQSNCAKNSDIIVLYQNANRHCQERIISTKP